jgi:3-deoxy-D-manno-octulosonic-acid transferase
VGEDALVLDAFAEARRELPNLLLLLAPRHPERFDAAADEARTRGFAVARVSSGDQARDVDVLLLDTIGELASYYVMASAAFVGGSLVRVGGHNLLEPLAAGVPVLFGPHTEHVAEIASALVGAGCGERVDDAAALGRSWARLASRPDERERRVAVGRDVLAAHRGALTRTADLVLDAWDRSSASRTV